MRLIIQPLPLRPPHNLIPILTHMHRPRPIRARYTRIMIIPHNLALERRLRRAHNRIPQVVETVIVMLELVLVERHVSRADLHGQRVHVRLHVVQAVHLVEHSQHVCVFAAEGGIFIEVHGRGQGVGGVVRDLEEAAALWGEFVPFFVGAGEGGGRFVVRVVAVVFDE